MAAVLLTVLSHRRRRRGLMLECESMQGLVFSISYLTTANIMANPVLAYDIDLANFQDTFSYELWFMAIG